MSKNVIARTKAKRSGKPAYDVGSSMVGVGVPNSVRNAIRSRTSGTNRNLVFCINPASSKS